MTTGNSTPYKVTVAMTVHGSWYEIAELHKQLDLVALPQHGDKIITGTNDSFVVKYIVYGPSGSIIIKVRGLSFYASGAPGDYGALEEITRLSKKGWDVFWLRDFNPVVIEEKYDEHCATQERLKAIGGFRCFLEEVLPIGFDNQKRIVRFLRWKRKGISKEN